MANAPLALTRTLEWLRAQRRRVRHSRRRLALLFAAVGPGLVTGTVNQDAGGIYSYSLGGAQYGYWLLWTLIPVGVLLYISEEMCARMGVVTGKGLSDLIREEFGFRITFLLMLAVLAMSLGNILAEFAGIAASMELFGVSRYVAVPLAALFIWGIVVRGTYRTVEKVFLVGCSFYVAYLLSAVLARPDWMVAAYHTVVPTVAFETGYLVLALALVGSTVAPWQHFYLQSSVVERGVSPRHYRQTRGDVFFGTLSCVVIVFSIVVACAATLHVARRTEIATAAEAAEALRPLAGFYASSLFAFGLLNASLLAASILPLSTAYVICEGLGLEASLNRPFREAPIFYWLYTALIVVGASLILVPGAPLVRIMVLSQVINGVVLPVVMIFVLVLVNRRELMGEFTNSRGYNAVAWSASLVIILLTLLLVYLGLSGKAPILARL